MNNPYTSAIMAAMDSLGAKDHIGGEEEVEKCIGCQADELRDEIYADIEYRLQDNPPPRIGIHRFNMGNGEEVVGMLHSNGTATAIQFPVGAFPEVPRMDDALKGLRAYWLIPMEEE